MYFQSILIEPFLLIFWRHMALAIGKFTTLPIISSVIFNNTLSPTLTVDADKCRQSKSRFCFTHAFFMFLPAAWWISSPIAFAVERTVSNIFRSNGSVKSKGSDFIPFQQVTLVLGCTWEWWVFCEGVTAYSICK